MKLVKPEEIYIIRKPKHSFLAIIEVDHVDFPLTSEISIVMEEMKKEGLDLFFVFHKEIMSRYINPSKFTALQEGIGFIVLDSTSSAHSIINIGEYIEETVKGYVGITYALLSEIENIKPEEIKETVGRFITYGTSLTKPVIEIERRDQEDLYNSYSSEPVSTVEEKKSGAFLGLLKETVENTGFEMLGSGSWETHTSKTKLPYFPISFFRKVREIAEEDGWYSSWDNCYSPINLICSAIKEFDLEFLDRSPEKLDLKPDEKKKRVRKSETTEGV